MTVSADEFLRRFLLRTLPGGFVRSRSFGFLAGTSRAALLQLARQLLPQPTSASALLPSDPARTSFRRPICSTPMIVLERLSPAMISHTEHGQALNDPS